MEFRQLQYFITVAEELHFGHAAEREHLTQAALSQQVRRLERELGVVLFDRTTRRVQLTEAGRVFLDDARTTLARARRAAETVRLVASGEVGRLVIGYPVTGRGKHASAIIRFFRSRYPEMALTAIPSCPVDLLEELRREQIDLAFVHHSIEDDPLLASRVISRQNYVLAMLSMHPLAAQRDVAVAQLVEERLLLCPRQLDPHHHDQLLRELSNGSDRSPRIVEEASTADDLIEAVAAGAGIAVLADSAATRFSGGSVVFRQFQVPVPTLPVAVAWRRNDQSAAVNAFLGAVHMVTDEFGHPNKVEIHRHVPVHRSMNGNHLLEGQRVAGVDRE